MKICIITIDHGKPALTSKLYSSIGDQIQHNVEIHFVVLENSGKVTKDDYQFMTMPKSENIPTEIHFLENDGYFGTASSFIKGFEINQFDWIVVCNNDLWFEKDFFLTLGKRQNDISDKYLICPGIIEQSRNINPLSRNKYPLFNKVFWDFYYRNRLFALFYEAIRIPISNFKFYLRSNISSNSSIEGDIYLGHGAIYLINPKFINALGGLPSETFLYQEESVICGHARNFGHWPYFLPTLKVHHASHATLQHIAFDRDYQLRRESWWATRKFLS
ncbi:hypothetical protein F6V25_09335 [Oryzomonas japonica]|uniref:Glycosyltransferase 2-like domain-containing protein n=1 Tax=Oryzomonas japonica TaxID=2603858 RepID=A0A7J4ZQA8_9BACT|nr:hypothetical protein [Oryzomonas japonica]KAB0665282.1 hypothetical protein F6V25_09335 [Oryzomonas japonica]